MRHVSRWRCVRACLALLCCTVRSFFVVPSILLASCAVVVVVVVGFVGPVAGFLCLVPYRTIWRACVRVWIVGACVDF